MNLQIIGEIRALGKEDEVGQREGSADNLRRLILCNRHLRRGIAHCDRLRGKRTLTRERQGIPHVLDVHCLGAQQGHIATDLLEVQRRHRNASRKYRLGHRNIRLIAVQEIQAVLDTTPLLAILDRDGQVVRLCL